MTTMRLHHYGFTLFACLAAGAFLLNAQTADTAILGRVTDPQGSVVPKATVKIVESSTRVARTATTGSEGNFEIRYLVPGEYSVEVSAQASVRSAALE